MTCNSSPDMVAFVRALCGKLQTVVKQSDGKGVQYVLTPELQGQMSTAKALQDRYSVGHYQHTTAEWERCKALAQWVADKYAEIHGHEKRVLHFNDRYMVKRGN